MFHRKLGTENTSCRFCLYYVSNRDRSSKTEHGLLSSSSALLIGVHCKKRYINI